MRFGIGFRDLFVLTFGHFVECGNFGNWLAPTLGRALAAIRRNAANDWPNADALFLDAGLIRLQRAAAFSST